MPGRSKLTADAAEQAVLRALSKSEERGEADRVRAILLTLEGRRAEEIRRKYADDPNVDVARIVNIDLVADGRPLAEVVGGQRFDYIVASHVFEHVPLQMRDLLSHGGFLSVALH